MQRIDDLLKELGFNPQAPQGSKDAFLRHLLQTANATSAQNFSTNSEQPEAERQLSFDAAVLGVQPRPSRR